MINCPYKPLRRAIAVASMSLESRMDNFLPTHHVDSSLARTRLTLSPVSPYRMLFDVLCSSLLLMTFQERQVAELLKH